MPNIPSKNPFENLFGGENNQTKPASKTNISSSSNNPFQGLFETPKAVTVTSSKPTVITPAIEQPKSLASKLGLPETTISTATPQAKTTESVWTKIAKAVLPKSLEDYFGLTSATEATPAENLKTQENAKQAYFREQRQTANISEVKATPEVYNAPTSTLGKAGEVIKYKGYVNNLVTGYLLPAVGTIAEQAGISTQIPELRSWGEKFADQTLYKSSITAESQSMQNVPAPLEGGLADPRYYAKTITQGVGFMGAILGSSVLVTAVTKNPIAGAATGYAVGAGLEDVGAYQDMIGKGVNPSDANTAAKIYGVAASLIENATGLKPALGAKKMVEEFSISAAKDAGIKEFFKKWVEEGIIEEGSQQLIQNIITKTVNKNQKFTEGVVDSMIGGLVGALPMVGTVHIYAGFQEKAAKKAATPAVPGVSEPEVVSPQQISAARDVLVSSKTNPDVNPELMAKLSDQLTTYQEKMATPVIEIKGEDNSTIADIKTVLYPDGRWGYSYSIDVPYNGIFSDFLSNKLSLTQEEAISSAKDELLNYAKQEINNVSDIESKADFENVIKHIEEVKPQENVPMEVKKAQTKTFTKKEEDQFRLRLEEYKLDYNEPNKGKLLNEIDQWMRYLNDKPIEALKDLGDSRATRLARDNSIAEAGALAAFRTNDLSDLKEIIRSQITKVKTAKETKEPQVSSLAEEAKKYKTAEEFGKSTFSLPIKEVNPMMSYSDFVKREGGTLPSKTPNLPVEITIQNGEPIILDGAHRYFEKLNAGDKTIQVKFAQGSSHIGEYGAVSEFYNQSTKGINSSKEEITLYRAAPEFPTDSFKKGTYFADTEQKARYYSESHYNGDPSDIKVEQFILPKDSVFREPSTGNFIIKKDVPVKIKSQLTNKKNQSATEKDFTTVGKIIYKDTFSDESYADEEGVNPVKEPTAAEYKKLDSIIKKYDLVIGYGEDEGKTISIKDPKNYDIKQAGDIFATLIDQRASETEGNYKTIRNDDGTFTLFHGTSKENADAIIKDGYNEGAYLSPASAKDAGGVGGAAEYGNTILESKIDPRGISYNGLGEIVIEDPAYVKETVLFQEKKKEKSPRAPAGIASAGRENIGNFENLKEANITQPEFKLFEGVKKLVEKYAKSIGEDYTPRGALGVYFRGSENIRIKGMNDLSVAAHEITHFLDFSYKISQQLRGIKGYSINGKPIYESESAPFRKEMTDLYLRYYPGAKETHSLEKRMVEGFATLLQKYAEMPTTMTSEYPNVVREFLTPEGKYYKPVMGEIIKDLHAMIAEYQGLPALDKIGARVINDKANVNKDSFLNFWQRFKTEVADQVYPIELLAKKAGVHFTRFDPSLWIRQYNSSSALITNNINGDKGFWGWRDGELKKLQKYNWKFIISELHKEKVTDQFGYWLVARREYFAFQELKELDKKLKDAEKLVKNAAYAVSEGMKAGADISEYKQDVKRVTAIYDEAKSNYDTIEGIIKNDGFTEKEVTEAYMENESRFSDYASMYDSLVAEDLKFLHDYDVGLVSDEEYKKLSSQKGYASFKRYFYDELVGEEEKTPTQVRLGTTKVSSMIKRTGSQKPIINPLFSAVTNHAEITRKGLKQIVSNKIGLLAPKLPDLFQQVQLKVIPDTQGRLIFPQEKDKNIIMARIGGKRVPFLTDATIKRTVDEVLNFQNLSIFEKVVLGSSRFFTKGTTGLFPGFAITNFTVDQITAAAQTRNKYRVLYDPLQKIFQTLKTENPQAKYFQEYLVMGGERQTLVGWQDMSPNELFDAIGKERKGLLKVIDSLNAGMNVLAIPSQWSEIATRATEYIKAREAGKTQIVALEEAGRVTAPFHHIGRLGGGRVGQTAIKSIPFFNPAIQVLAQAAETLETPEGRARYAFVAGAVVAASIASCGWIMAGGSDDQKKEYADKHPDELNKYIWYPLPGGQGLGKIRVPDQMEVFATLFNMMWADKVLHADYTVGEYINAGMAWLPAQADISQPIKLVMAFVPQIIKPGVLTLAGVKDYPKIMPLESQSLQNRAPEFRYTATTSPVAKWLGSAFGLSPIKIDYLITGYAGRAAGFLTGKPGIYNPLSQLSSAYYFESGRKIQSYYDLKEKNDQAYEAYKNGRKDYSLGERTAILKQKAKLAVIGSTITLYKDIDDVKQPEKAAKVRDKILNLIDEL